jgi:hypothetical protein
MFSALVSASFNPAKTVFLETSPPGLNPSNLGQGTVNIVQNTTDHETITADNSAPALLMITDNYSKYWTASPMPGDTQRNYQVLPADYTLTAIPLSPGHHVIDLEYRPPFFTPALWVSGIGALAFAMVFAWEFWPYRFRPAPETEPVSSPPHPKETSTKRNTKKTRRSDR